MKDTCVRYDLGNMTHYTFFAKFVQKDLFNPKMSCLPNNQAIKIFKILTAAKARRYTENVVIFAVGKFCKTVDKIFRVGVIS